MGALFRSCLSFWPTNLGLLLAIANGGMGGQAWAQTPPEGNPLDLEPALVENSPTLQRWWDKTPDLFEQNSNDPAFLTRVRLGYNYFSDDDQSSGAAIGVEDLFIGQSPLSLSGDYYTNFAGQQGGGANLQYYLLPLGWYVNVTPLVGYRAIAQNDYHSEGINVGGKVVLALSRPGAADISFSQNFVAPGGTAEVGISTLSVGYALTPQWRLATDLQRQNSPAYRESRFGVYLEWQPQPR
ncbi:hypothetical protein IQ218_05915 [Synechocystis salina LEGE 06099]|uniref:hypothetical protein n=1 Tax=Synechocystis salina TaxID=945780 RepID=UPI00187EBAEC|nr:hypothetical protein [Synechocystis salina]MBE9203080.1 hypothetical protein [Synechocystis salina LEGE 06099]